MTLEYPWMNICRIDDEFPLNLTNFGVEIRFRKVVEKSAGPPQNFPGK